MDQKTFSRIDTHDFAWYIMQKGKIIIAFTIVFALLIGGLYKINLTMKKDVPIEKELESIKTGLTSEEISKVESSAKNILNYKNMYSQQKKYIDNSIFQSIDPYNIFSVNLEYYVDNNYEVVYPIVDKNNNIVPIIQAYSSMLQSDDLFIEMVNTIDSTQTQSNFSELVIVDTSQQEFGAFSVVIYANDASTASKISEIVESYLKKNNEVICSNYGTHSLELTSKTDNTVVDTTVAEKQQRNLNNLYEINNSINKEESLYSGKQLEYLQGLTHEKLVEEESMLKYLVLGAVAGAFGSLVIIMIVYLASNKIRSVEEVLINTNISFVGELYKEINVKNPIDKKIISMRKKDRNKTSYDEKIEMLASEISCLLEKKSLNSVGLVLNDGDYIGYANEIEARISNKFSSCVIVDILCNPKAIAMLSNQEEVILFEKVDNSKYSRLNSEINKCDEFDVDVLGVILVN